MDFREELEEKSWGEYKPILFLSDAILILEKAEEYWKKRYEDEQDKDCS